MEEVAEEQTKCKNFTYTLPRPLVDTIDQFVRYKRKFEEPALTKQAWILDALRTKLDSDMEKQVYGEKERRISLQIDSITLKKLQHRVEIEKKFRRTCSMKRIIEEAIIEKAFKEKSEMTLKFNNISR